MNAWSDADADEAAVARELERPLGSLRSRGSRCPEPALLTAARAGVLPEDLAATVTAHLRDCGICQTLERDMADPELAAPGEQERKRIHASVLARADADLRRKERPTWVWWWRPMPAAAALVAVLAVVSGWWMTRGPERLPTPGPPSVARPSVATPPVAPAVTQPPTHLAFEKPPVTVPLATALIWRSDSGPGQEKYLVDLANALAPYRADDFAEAVVRLGRLARAHPTAEVWFYLGVSRLFLGQNDEAVADLRRARELAQATFRQDASWYLAVASERAGLPESEAAELRALCGEKGARQAHACEMLAALQPTRR